MLGQNTIARRALLAIVPCLLLGFGAGYAFGGDGATADPAAFKAVKLKASTSRPAIDAPSRASSLPALIPPRVVIDTPGDDAGGGNPPPPPPPPPPPVPPPVPPPPPPPPPPGEEF